MSFVSAAAGLGCSSGFADFTYADDQEAHRDAPISLQLVGRRYEDEKVLQAYAFIAEVAGLPTRV